MLPNETIFLGVTGHAGSGKTTLAHKVCEASRTLGVVSDVLSLDAFFILSSKDRSEWLSEFPPGHPEHESRSNQINWWDFDKLKKSLQTLRSDKKLHLEGTYNRADKGDLTGSISIQLENTGTNLVIVEGVAIAHPEVSDFLDHLWLVDTQLEERKDRLFNRDQSRRSNPELAQERFKITQAFEIPYFSEFGHNVSIRLQSQNDRFYKLSK